MGRCGMTESETLFVEAKCAVKEIKTMLTLAGHPIADDRKVEKGATRSFEDPEIETELAWLRDFCEKHGAMDRFYLIALYVLPRNFYNVQTSGF